MALVEGVLETVQFETEPLVAPVAVLEYKRLQVKPLSKESETWTVVDGKYALVQEMVCAVAMDHTAPCHGLFTTMLGVAGVMVNKLSETSPRHVLLMSRTRTMAVVVGVFGTNQ